MADLSQIDVDERAFPLVVIRWHGALDDATFERYLSACETVLAYRTRFALILDATAAKSLTKAQRQRQADWFRDRADALAEDCAGLCMVIASPFARRLLQGLALVTSMPCPYTVCATADEARAWCTARLGAASTR